MLSSEGTLSRCPEFARFTLLEILVLELTGVYGDSATGGWGLVSDWWESPLKVVVSTRLAPWETE